MLTNTSSKDWRGRDALWFIQAFRRSHIREYANNNPAISAILTSLLDLCEFFSEPHEEFTAIARLKSVTDVENLSVYCVGSLRYKPQEIEPTGGRLYAFAASYQQSTMQISVLASEEVNGCVYAVTVVGDLIAAAVNSAVRLIVVHYVELLSRVYSR